MKIQREKSKKPSISDIGVKLFTQGKYNPSYFVRHIFLYLRKNMDLTNIKEYKMLYEELVEYLLFKSGRENNEKNRLCLEQVCDLEANSPIIEDFTREQVDSFLAHRLELWRLTGLI